MLRYLVCVATLLLPLAAQAQDASSVEAKAHYQRGLSAYALEHFAQAADEYEKAFDLKPDPALLYNAAQAHRLAGNYERALHLYQSYLRTFGKRAAKRDEVERHITELEATLAQQKKAQSSPPTGVVEPEGSLGKAQAPLPGPVNEATNRGAPPETAQPIVLVATAPPPGKPLYKKGWFWGVVTGAAVVVGVGVGLGVGLSAGGTRNPTGSFGTTTVTSATWQR